MGPVGDFLDWGLTQGILLVVKYMKYSELIFHDLNLPSNKGLCEQDAKKMCLYKRWAPKNQLSRWGDSP